MSHSRRKKSRYASILVLLGWAFLILGGTVPAGWGAAAAGSAAPGGASPLFTNTLVPRLDIEIPEEGMITLRNYRQVWGQPRPDRVDVKATVREAGRIYTNVSVHLKGSFTFQPVDGKPSLTLNFSKFAPGQLFHGLDKVHLNNSVQDPTFLCESLARELFLNAGVPAPRAGPARVTLNRRELGPYVALEGANKRFLKRFFRNPTGNLYDGGSGGDIHKKLEADSGEDQENRSDLEALLAASRERIVSTRQQRLEQLLDVDRFLSFSALEVLVQHWDGYCMGPNNFRLFHDAARDKMVFIPHGMDQIFGTGRTPPSSLTPTWKGTVAHAWMTVPGGRSRYLARLGQVFTNQFQSGVLLQRVDQMAARLRPDIAPGFLDGLQYRAQVEALKGRIQHRTEEIQRQLEHPERTLAFGADGTAALAGWAFKNAAQRRATGRRFVEEGREILEVQAGEIGSSGAWRTTVLLAAGSYEFTGLARVSGITSTAPGTNTGVILRVSGERSTKGLTVPSAWTPLTYQFEIPDVVNAELVCEFRGAEGAGRFDLKSLRLRRR